MLVIDLAFQIPPVYLRGKCCFRTITTIDTLIGIPILRSRVAKKVSTRRSKSTISQTGMGSKPVWENQMRRGKKYFSRRPDWRVSDGGGWGRLFFRSRIQEEAQSETGKKFKKCSNQSENGTVREKRLREVKHKCTHVEYNSTKKSTKTR